LWEYLLAPQKCHPDPEQAHQGRLPANVLELL